MRTSRNWQRVVGRAGLRPFPGCFTVHAQAEGPPAIFWGDVIYYPVQMLRFDLPFAFGADPATANVIRHGTLARAADDGTMCFPAHFRRTSTGRVQRDGELFKYKFIEDRHPS